MKAKTRFERFQEALRQATGDIAQLQSDGQVLVLRNEFSPDRWFASLQQAIDHFHRYMPDDLTDDSVCGPSAGQCNDILGKPGHYR